MIRRNIAAKLGISIMVLILAVSVMQYVILSQLLRNAFYEQTGSELLAQGRQYANMTDMGGTMLMQMVGPTADASLLMMDKNQNIVAASMSLHLSRPNAEDNAVIRAALGGQASQHGGYSALFENSGIIAAAPIIRWGLVSGAIILFRPDTIIETAFGRVEWLLLLTGAGGVLVALLLTVILSNRIAGPLKQMAVMAREMSRGNYMAKIPIHGEDEVGKLGEAINELSASLHHLDTSRKEFLADISHELRTPMSYIRGYSQVVEEGLFASPEEMKKYLRIIHDESERLEGLVNDLFALAQADAGMLQIVKKPIQLQGVIESVVERMRKKAEDKQIEIHSSVALRSAIEVDDARIKQVLVNLIDNAIRYTPSHGRIDVNLQRLNGWAEIRVADTGVGIPKSDLPYIWDRLYRVEKSRSRTSGGTGLGLAIVKQIIEAHGGNVHAESEENEGTTISLRLPMISVVSEANS